MRSIISVFLLLFLGGSALFFLVQSGIYNIAGSQPHPQPVQWLLATVADNSVRFRAAAITIPPLSRYNRDRGFRHFDTLCVDCHGAPGVLPSPVGLGLSPAPPPLADQVQGRPLAELFWIIEHGLKFTGMPAFGNSKTGEDIWDLITFIQELPALSGSDYQQLKQNLGAPPAPDCCQDPSRGESPPRNDRRRFLIRYQDI